MSIYDLKKNPKSKLLDLTSNGNSTLNEKFKFNSYSEKLNNTNGYQSNRSLNSKTSTTRFNNSLNHTKVPKSNLIHSKLPRIGGKVQKAKPKRIVNTNLECFNLMEKEKFRQLIEQNDNFRSVKNSNALASSISQRNVYKHFIHASPTRTRDDYSSDTEKTPQLINPAQARVSAGYSRRISLSLDTKPESMNKETGASYFNKYSNNGILKNTSNSNKYQSNSAQVIDIIDITSNNNSVKCKFAQKRPGPLISESDDIENFRKEKKEFFSQYTINSNHQKLTRSLNDFEKSINERLKSNQSIIEAVLKKSQTKIDANLFIEEERYKLKKRQRQEKDLIERELAQKFTQQLHVDSNKFTGKYLEQELEVEEENDFPDLQEEHNHQIDNALINSPQEEVLVNAFNISICRKDIQTLKGLNWLNDEVINFYMSLICERSKDETRNLPKVHAFTTFFYPKLIKDGYTMLRRWTRKIDIFSFDLILVPLHLGLHWTLAVIDFNCREVRYYDSMNGNNGECLKALRNYLNEEHKDKKGSPYDLSDWNFLHNKNLPQQMNGSDCGMFACKYSEYLSRGKTAFNFNQSHMPYFRRRMIWEILNTQLMT